MACNTEWPGAKVLAALPAKAFCMTIDELVTATGYDSRRISKLIRGLKDQGFVISMHDGCYARTLEGDAVVASGQQLKSGAKKGSQRKRYAMPNTASARLWRALRILQRGTYHQLLEISGCKEQIRTRRYLARLVEYGVVTISGRRVTPPRGGAPMRQYILQRNLGPAAPVWQEKAGVLWDPNKAVDLQKPSAEVAP